MLENILTPVSIVGGLGLLFGIGLSYASKKFAVKVDERVDLVRAVLPGANCAACGYSGCDAFAEALVQGEASVNSCPVGGAAMVSELCSIMGMECEEGEPVTARVMCRGNNKNSVHKFDYSGIEDCAAAFNLYGGPLACSYGCVGMGACQKVCPFDAIVIEDGLARIIESECRACGKCISVCPKNLIKLVPKKSQITVTCSSLDKGGVVRKNCKVGCIGCRKCAKECPVDAITFKGTLAAIDPARCINCGKCVKVCPTGAIKEFTEDKVLQEVSS